MFAELFCILSIVSRPAEAFNWLTAAAVAVMILECSVWLFVAARASCVVCIGLVLDAAAPRYWVMLTGFDDRKLDGTGTCLNVYATHPTVDTVNFIYRVKQGNTTLEPAENEDVTAPAAAVVNPLVDVKVPAVSLHPVTVATIVPVDTTSD